MVKQVLRWEAEDGTLFDTEEEAKAHALRGNMLDFVYKNISVCRDSDDAEEIIDFIEEYTKGWK